MIRCSNVTEPPIPAIGIITTIVHGGTAVTMDITTMTDAPADTTMTGTAVIADTTTIIGTVIIATPEAAVLHPVHLQLPRPLLR